MKGGERGLSCRTAQVRAQGCAVCMFMVKREGGLKTQAGERGQGGWMPQAAAGQRQAVIGGHWPRERGQRAAEEGKSGEGPESGQGAEACK